MIKLAVFFMGIFIGLAIAGAIQTWRDNNLK